MELQVNKNLRKRKIIKACQVYSLGIIPLILVFIFNYIPMFGIIIAFKDYKYSKGIFGSEWVGFENFELFVRSKDFALLVRNPVG